MSTAAPDRAPILVLGWGNPSRGDDALGPAFVTRAAALPRPTGAPAIEWLTDFQLQVEHALDLSNRRHVLFVDASVDTTAPFTATTLRGATDRPLTSHALSPQAVMQVFAQINGHAPPPCTLLAIRAEAFELGADMGADAARNLEQALDWFAHWWARQATAPAATAPCTS